MGVVYKELREFCRGSHSGILGFMVSTWLIIFLICLPLLQEPMPPLIYRGRLRVYKSDDSNLGDSRPVLMVPSS
jgi:hypothetical protein